MKFVAISDTHCRHNNVKLPKGDVLLHAGDITYKGEKTEVFDFLKWFEKQNYKHKIFIAGNHDFYFEREKEETIQGLMPAGITYLKDSGVRSMASKYGGRRLRPGFTTGLSTGNAAMPSTSTGNWFRLKPIFY